MLHNIKILKFAFIFLIILPVSATEEKWNFGIQEVGIRTVKDYLNLCETLIKGEKKGMNSYIRKSVCLSYIRGLLDGYMGTLSVSVEYDLANDKNIDHKQIYERIDKDEKLHGQLTERKFEKYFICYGNEYLYDLAIKLTNHVAKLNIDFEKANANYVLLSELRNLYPCPDK